jgi:hypothetical protein
MRSDHERLLAGTAALGAASMSPRSGQRLADLSARKAVRREALRHVCPLTWPASGGGHAGLARFHLKLPRSSWGGAEPRLNVLAAAFYTCRSQRLHVMLCASHESLGPRSSS